MFFCASDLNHKHSYGKTPVGCRNTGRHSHLQGSFGVEFYCRNTKTFAFVRIFFLFFTDMLPHIMTRFCCTNRREKTNKKPGRHDQYMYFLFIIIIPAWLCVCPATRLVLKQLHVAIHLPPSQMDLCHFGRCFSALIHCSNCFMLAHLGLVVERAFLDHFILMHFWCHRFPI